MSYHGMYVQNGKIYIYCIVSLMFFCVFITDENKNKVYFVLHTSACGSP